MGTRNVRQGAQWGAGGMVLLVLLVWHGSVSHPLAVGVLITTRPKPKQTITERLLYIFVTEDTARLRDMSAGALMARCGQMGSS